MSSAVDRFVAAAAELGVELRVTRYPEGTPDACFPAAPAELARLAAARVVDIAAGAVSGRTPS